MSYQCLDCTYTARVFPGGACPGCGSPRIKRLQRRSQHRRTRARRPYRMVFAWALWAYLFYLGLSTAGYL